MAEKVDAEDFAMVAQFFLVGTMLLDAAQTIIRTVEHDQKDEWYTAATQWLVGYQQMMIAMQQGLEAQKERRTEPVIG